MSKVLETPETGAVEVLPKLETMPEKDRATFLKTGELPGDEKSAGVEPEKVDAKTGVASDATEQQQESATEEPPRKSRYQRRIDKQTAQIKTLETQLAALQQKGTESRSAPPAVSADTSKAPNFKSFTDKIGTTYGDWESAHEAWELSMHAFYANQSKQAIAEVLKAEREKLEQAKTEEAAAKTTETHAKSFAKRSEEFRKTLKEDTFQQSFMDVYEAVNEVLAGRPEVSQIADILVESDVGPELVHYFGQNPDEFDAILDMPIVLAIRKLGQLEVSDKIKTPTPKTKTAAKRIGSQVGGNTGTGADPVQEALAKNDVLAYIKAMNAQEAAERRNR